MASNSNRRSNSSVSGSRNGAHARPSGQRGASGRGAAPDQRAGSARSHARPKIPTIEEPAPLETASDDIEVGGDRRGRRGRRGGRGGKIRALLIVIVVLLVAAGVSWGVLGHTDVFKITSIDVKNTSRLSDNYLTALVDIPEGTNLMNIDTNDVKERLTANPWIEKVSVHRSYPHTLVLDIEENMPTAVVQVDPATAIGATEYWFISGDGIWMSQVSSTGIEQAREVVMDSTGSEDLTAAIEETPVVDDPLVDTDGDGVPDAAAGSVDEDGDGIDDNTGEPIAQTTTVHEDEDGDGYDDYTNEWIGGSEEDSDDSDDSSDEAADEKADDAAKENAGGEQSVCADAFVTVEELAKIPVVSGVAIGVQPETGKQETDAGVINALNILEGADEEFRAQIASITSATGDSTDIMLNNGIEVAFGPATDIQSKIRIVEQLIEEHPDSIAYINVRVVSRPSWRGF